MSFAALTEHDLYDLREDFEPPARWLNAVSAAGALSRFADNNHASNNKISS